MISLTWQPVQNYIYLKKTTLKGDNPKKKLIIEIMISSTCTELILLVKQLQKEIIF